MEDRESLRNSLDRQKQLDYLSSVASERDRLSTQIEQLKRQIGQMTQKMIDLDKEWRQGILSVSATQCRPVPTPTKRKKVDPSEKQMTEIQKKLKSADPKTQALVIEQLKKAGIEF
jgi:ATP-dependent exoDNAse (exonuclease V) beta subunit